MEYITERYESLNAFAKALERERVGYLSHDFDSEFIGVKDEETANKLFLYGDEKTAHLIQDAKTKRERTAKKTTVYRSQCGFIPNIGAVMAGHPLNMLNVKQEPKKTKVLNLVYLVGCSYKYKPTELAQAGEKMLNIVNTLEARGYRVNLYAADVSHPTINHKKNDTGKVVTVLVKIKDAGKHLNISKIAYPLANPAFFRYHIFKWYDTVIKDATNAFDASNDEITKALHKVFPVSPKNCAWESFYTVRNKTEKEILENIFK
jgi:hypothetical protein